MIVFLVILFLSCLFPPLFFCWEEYLLPKWYISLSVICFYFLYFGIKANISLKLFKQGVSIAACFGIVFETIWVLGQLLYYGKSVLEIGVCGTFGNPGGLAVAICLLLSLSFADSESCFFYYTKYKGERRKLFFLSFIFFLAIVLIVLSKSRTGFVSLTIIVLMFIGHIFQLKKKYMLLILFILIILVGSIISFQKTNSTLGRFFILELTWDLIKERPLCGYGMNGFQYKYMSRQEEYFSLCNTGHEAMLADEVLHPLNEFLLLWLDFGIIGPIILILLLIMPIWAFRHSFIIKSIQITLFLFCLLSYPLNQPLPCLLILFLSFSSIFILFPSSKMFFYKIKKCVLLPITILLFLIYIVFLPVDVLMSLGNYKSMVRSHYKSLYYYKKLDSLSMVFPYNLGMYYRRSSFLYNYSYELFVTAKFNEALEKINECSTIMSSYNMELLAGDICLHHDIPRQALKHYNKAANMCPVRFAPLEGMLLAYRNLNDTTHVDSVALVIKYKPIKVMTYDITRIKRLVISLN